MSVEQGARGTAGTKAKIRVAAGRVFEQRGMGGLTMRAIAAEVGITATALYRHYPNREAILEDVWRVGFEDLASAMSKPIEANDAAGRILVLTDRYILWALGQSELYELKHRYDSREQNILRRGGIVGGAESSHDPIQLLIGEIEQGIASGCFAPGDVWEMALSIWSLAHGLLSLHRSGQVLLTDDQLRSTAQSCMTPLLRGLAPS